MSRANPYAALADPDSDMVRAALTRRCEVCKAQPGHVCENRVVKGVQTAPMVGRIVHYARTLEAGAEDE